MEGIPPGDLQEFTWDYCRNLRLRSPSIPRETTRDELIDSIVHTRTREHRPLPGFKSASDYDERRHLRIDCDKVYDGIILGNGDTICNMNYLQGIGVTHVLNTAEVQTRRSLGNFSPIFPETRWGQSCQVSLLWHQILWISRWWSARVQHLQVGFQSVSTLDWSLSTQILPHHHLLHRPSCQERGPCCSQLRHGLVQICLSNYQKM